VYHYVLQDNLVTLLFINAKLAIQAVKLVQLLPLAQVVLMVNFYQDLHVQLVPLNAKLVQMQQAV
jgi:hypothetical protein